MGKRRSSSRSSRRVLKTKRLFSVLGAFLLLGGSVYGLHTVQTQRQAANLLEVARAARDGQDWEKAADFYKQYSNYRKNDAEGFSEYAGVLEQIAMQNWKWWAWAATAYEKVMNIAPNRHEDRKKAAALYLRYGRYGAARPHLETLVQSGVPEYSNDPALYEMLSQCDAAERNAAGLQMHLQKAVATGKAKSATYYELANLIRLNPNAALEADHLMNEFIAARPMDLSARLARARYRVRYGDRTGAVEDIRVAYAEIPGGNIDVDIILQHAELLAETDREAARKVIEDGLKIHPENTWLKLGLAEVMNRSGAGSASAKILLDAAAKLPDGDPQLATIGDRLIELNELESALAIAQRLEKSPVQQQLARYLVGRVAARRGNWPEAILALETSLPALGSRWDLMMKARMALGASYALANDDQREEANFAAASAIDRRSISAKMGWANALAKLGRDKDATELYREMAKAVPAARFALAMLKFREILALPEAERNWAEFEALLGPTDQLEPQLEVAYAQCLALQNLLADAENILRASIEREPKNSAAWIALTGLIAPTDLDGAWATVDEAAKQLGDRIEFRLAKAQLLIASGRTFPAEAILGLAGEAGPFSPGERSQLWKSLGLLLASHGRPKEAVELLRKAADEQPYDLDVRFALFDLATRIGMIAEADRAFEEIRKLDGESGPVASAAEFGREIARSGWLTPERLTYWKPRIEAAILRRSNWGRLHVIAGDIASLENRQADSLKHYLHAIQLRDSNPAILRRVTELLMEQQRYGEAAQILGKPETRSGLSLELLRQYELARAAAGLELQTLALARVRNPMIAQSPRFREQLARASVFLRYGQTEEALEALQFAKSLNDASPQIRVAIVRLLVIAGQTDAAKREVAGAERRLRDPRLKFDNPAEVPAALGLCKELVGDLPGAIREYAEAARAKPADPQGWNSLYSAYRQSGNAGEAAALLDRVAASATPEIVKWARKLQAAIVVESLFEATRGTPGIFKKWW